jgi:hypothetical protein
MNEKSIPPIEGERRIWYIVEVGRQRKKRDIPDNAPNVQESLLELGMPKDDLILKVFDERIHSR